MRCHLEIIVYRLFIVSLHHLTEPVLEVDCIDFIVVLQYQSIVIKKEKIVIWTTNNIK